MSPETAHAKAVSAIRYTKIPAVFGVHHRYPDEIGGQLATRYPGQVAVCLLFGAYSLTTTPSVTSYGVGPRPSWRCILFLRNHRTDASRAELSGVQCNLIGLSCRHMALSRSRCATKKEGSGRSLCHKRLYSVPTTHLGRARQRVAPTVPGYIPHSVPFHHVQYTQYL